MLRLALPDVMEDATNELPTIARLALQRAHQQWLELDSHIAWCDERIAAHVRSDEQARVAIQLCGIGPVTASALVATVGDFRQFKTGAQFGSWLGLVPRQNSSGGKVSLGCITKHRMQSFSRDPVPVDGCQPRTTAVAVADFLGGLNEGQVPRYTGRSLGKPPPAAMGRQFQYL